MFVEQTFNWIADLPILAHHSDSEEVSIESDPPIARNGSSTWRQLASGAIKVRCGDCREWSFKFRDEDTADLLGLIYKDSHGIWFLPAIHKNNMLEVQGDGRAVWTRTVFADPRSLSEGIRKKCRHGHDLKCSYPRLLRLKPNADGVLYISSS
jgi:hypothetical protein